MTRPMAIRNAMAFLGCLTGFGMVAWLVIQPGISPLDWATTDVLHGVASPTLDALMNAATFLGSSPMLAAVVGLAVVPLLVRRRRAEAVFIVVAFVGALVLNDWLKSVFQRPRPGVAWAAVWPETGFPSGHSMGSFVVYVAIALIIWRLGGRRTGSVALILAVALAASVGISRIYLGAHWLSDVIGGYLAGALWLLALVAASALVSPIARGGRRDAAPGDRDVRPTPS